MLKIYLTDLAAYNKGALIGEWVSLPCDDIQSEINKILSYGSDICHERFGYYEEHEEYFITDYEWDDVSLFGIDEYDNLALLNDKVEQISTLNSQELKKIRYMMNQVGYDFDGAISNLDDCDIYEGMSLNDLAYEFIDEGLFGTIPDNIKNFLDYDAIARDLSYDYTEYEDDIFRAG